MALNEDEYEVLSYIEQEFLLSGFIPSKEVILSHVSLAPVAYDKLLLRSDFNTALKSRGIKFDSTSGGVLTREQLNCINTLLDQNDNRSDKKKLADLNIATKTYQGWCKDPAFSSYLRQRTEALFPDGVNEANRALVDNVKRGDLGSIKLIYEMTGRWSSKPVAEMNIEWVLMKVIETIQRHVTDPETLAAIATDLAGVQEAAVPSVQPFQPLPLHTDQGQPVSKSLSRLQL